MAAVTISSVQPEKAGAFLSKLATDDDFRSRVENDPKGQLAAYGITIDGLPDQVKLPSKEALQNVVRAKPMANIVQPQGDHIAFVAFFAFLA